MRSAQLSRTRALAAAALLLLALAGCGSTDTHAATATDSASVSASTFVLPPAGAAPDYQLGGAYEPAAGVGIVGRDRSDDPAAGLYSICYVNGFQSQPGELESWSEDLVLQRDGAPVFDPDWPDEALLDTSTDDRRQRIAEVVGPWIQGCADAGFDAVEFDNLDSYTRSVGALSLEDNLALAKLLVDIAHDSGLAAGQKNTAEDAARLHEDAGFDFAVVEECGAYDECAAFTAVYGEHVVDIEYSDELPRTFAEMCADDEAPPSMVLRDRDLVTPGHEEYVFETCS